MILLLFIFSKFLHKNYLKLLFLHFLKCLKRNHILLFYNYLIIILFLTPISHFLEGPAPHLSFFQSVKSFIVAMNNRKYDARKLRVFLKSKSSGEGSSTKKTLILRETFRVQIWINRKPSTAH